MKNRKFIYIPEINPKTFLLFYHRGKLEDSYSLRDYSLPSSVKTTHGRKLTFKLNDIISMAKFSFDAPVHDTNDILFWSSQIEKLNRKYLTSITDEKSTETLINKIQNQQIKQTKKSNNDDNFLLHGTFPVLRRNDLLSHATKGSKLQDIKRIFTSSSSEDYVTWNILQLLSLLNKSDWWKEILSCAKKYNPDIEINFQEDDLPICQTWPHLPSPIEYEKNSRKRMSQSRNPEWVARSKNPLPVEGLSEIDIFFEGTNYVVFIEAKLFRDLSMNTTYDPERNQIVRNIDILLDTCIGKIPAFWMIVRDTDPRHAYVQLMQKYQNNYKHLYDLLFHRKEEEILRVTKNLSIILWKDVYKILRIIYDQLFVEIEKRIII